MIGVQNFGIIRGGYETKKYTISLKNGISAEITDLGATLVSLKLPDSNIDDRDIVLGFDSAQQYFENHMNLGASVGRFANRIAYGKFCIENKEYHISQNIYPHSIHGGTTGFQHKIWKLEKITDNSICLSLLSKDMDEGFPGNLTVLATYSLFDVNTLTVEYRAFSDKPTICSITNHTYWNLCGHKSGRAGLNNHLISVYSDRVCDIDKDKIPTGIMKEVSGTIFDLRIPKPIEDILKSDELIATHGLDHPYALSGKFRKAATVYDPLHGRKMEIFTNAPCAQVYSGNNIEMGTGGKDNAIYGPWQSFCFETQHFPDAPNHISFPSAILLPGEQFRFITEYRFSGETF